MPKPRPEQILTDTEAVNMYLAFMPSEFAAYSAWRQRIDDAQREAGLPIFAEQDTRHPFQYAPAVHAIMSPPRSEGTDFIIWSLNYVLRPVKGMRGFSPRAGKEHTSDDTLLQLGRAFLASGATPNIRAAIAAADALPWPSKSKMKLPEWQLVMELKRRALSTAVELIARGS